MHVSITGLVAYYIFKKKFSNNSDLALTYLRSRVDRAVAVCFFPSL